ncbi:tRNA (adenosine(37)-N6)-dimethylallyltransferase MiaA [Peptoniphilus sp. oral taxon 386]|uniref:tRNA (adenosine(37)-N6)-dimethylallyltransferase MiaA n=1 Tax=Peptoniphilus sp. oral taxon 386 TaxID=652713 RepID=UPI0001DA9D47|nr:tRNA (adenosine(37)-N6)-dimethylallyltransferase MiaA [Peptoniphilus sp. oral taxon 386]EFI42299.1 tRNA dimethylallyltransferase [Peptoniphilus sp. oral taxon 386 str. F0131]
MDNLLILTGPTGIGKTELSLSISRKYNCEIISADSMQIYKEMDIGTAKININETDIPHYMIDVVYPCYDFSVADFKKQSVSLISEINKNGKLPFIVGGTGLYINSLVYDLSFQRVKKNEEYRNYLESLINKNGVLYLYEKLKEKNINIANKIDKNNRNRIIRALEILEFSSDGEYENLRKENNNYNLLFLGINMKREKLYEKINNRVDLMIEQGLVQEVKFLLNKYKNCELNSFKAIGYKEIISYLKSELTLDEAIDLIKKNSRHYAKRQITWFKRDSRIIWFDKDDKDLEEKIMNTIGEKFGKI